MRTAGGAENYSELTDGLACIDAGDAGGHARRHWPLAGAVACTIAVAACSGGVAGIFFTLATETKTGDRNLENELNISAMTTSAGAHYVAAGAIWARSVWDWCECDDDAAHTWTKLNDDHAQPALATALVATTFSSNDEVFAGFFFPQAATAAARHGLYRWITPGNLASASWSEVNITPASGDEQIVDLFLIDEGVVDRLAVVTATEDSNGTFAYALFYSTDGIAFTAAKFNGSATRPQRPTAIVYHAPSLTHFVVAGVEVYSGDITAMLAESTLAPHAQAGIEQPPLGYTGALLSTADWLYLADRQGHIYSSNDGGASWTQYPDPTSDPSQITISSTVVQFTQMTQKGATIFVGTEGFGYFSFSDDAAPDANGFVRGPEFTTPDLYDGAITGFSTPPNTATIFVHTGGVGLWSTVFDGTDVTAWVRE